MKTKKWFWVTSVVLVAAGTCGLLTVNELKADTAITAEKAKLTGQPLPAQPQVEEKYRAGTGETLQKEGVGDIESMQIFKLVPDGDAIDIETEQDGSLRLRGVKQQYTQPALDKTTIEGILTLARNAAKYVRPTGAALAPAIPDYLLVLKLVVFGARGPDEANVAIPYNSYLDAPFGEYAGNGGLQSRQLKEALYAATRGGIYSIILEQDGKALDTINPLPLPTLGGPRRADLWDAEVRDTKNGANQSELKQPLEQAQLPFISGSLRLTEKGQLMLKLQIVTVDVAITDVIKPVKKSIWEDEQVVRYGQATTFKSLLGTVRTIVLLQNPQVY